jgi:hypothetical protein
MSEDRSNADDGHRAIPLARAAYRLLDDAGLIAAMQRRDERAIDEFIVRYQRLLSDRVRQWRVSLGDTDALIADVLEDIAVLIVNRRINPSRSLAAYVTKSFRARLAHTMRADDSRRAFGRRVAEPAPGAADSALAGSVSQGTLRASRGDADPVPSAALVRLASLLEQGLRDDERQILVWMANYVPQRQICEWLGTSYAAGTQRIWRLRERLRASARRHAATLDPREQSELSHFLRRIDVAAPPGRRRRSGGAITPDHVGSTGVPDDEA